jgi:protein-disulfide isomerase/uncharacterized membrane protein
MARTRIAVALLLCFAGGALTLLLLSTHYGVPLLGAAALAACGEGGGCDIVSQSRYAVFLGVPLAAWGLLFYGSFAALLAPALVVRNRDEPDPGLSVAFFLGATAVVIDVVLFGLQIVAIKAFCKFCIATYFVNLGLVASLWPHRQLSRAASFLFAPEGRKALVAWTVATLWVGATAAAGNFALAGRRELAGNSILGVPTLIQAPRPAEKGSVDEQLAQAQAEAKKFKEILDDERKLQIYLNQKARDDFNKAEVARLDLSRAPSQGAKKGPIAVVSFSDFMCPFCRDLAAGLKNYLPTTGNQVTSHYKYFPLDTSCNARIGSTLHPGSCELSLGGICAGENGRFWEYHDKVFAQRWDKATRQDVLRIGASIGLDGNRLAACMDAAATRGLLAKDIDEGWRVGVASTPTIFVNGRKLPSTGVFLLAIEEERKRLNLAPVTGTPAPQEKQGDKSQ